MARSGKDILTVVEVRESEGTVEGALRRPLLDADQAEVVRTLVDVSERYQTIFDLDPEPEKPLRINLNLDQLEDFEE